MEAAKEKIAPNIDARQLPITLTTPMMRLPIIEPMVPSEATNNQTAATAAAIDSRTTRIGDIAIRTLAMAPPMVVITDAMAMLADATSEDNTETNIVTTDAKSEPMNETAVAIAVVMMLPITANADAKKLATAEITGVSAATIIVPSVENALRMPVMMVEHAERTTVPTEAKADATT